MQLKYALLLFIGLVSRLCLVRAQDTFDPPTVTPSFFAIETEYPLQLDGELTEPAWKKAQVVTDFFRTEPRQGGKYLYKTRAQVAYDKKNLYFGIFCEDSVGRKGIRVQDYRRDFLSGNNDELSIQLDPQNLKRYCISFHTTPLGTQRDLQVFDDSFVDNDWDALWRVRTHVTDSGYYAEFAIPFKSLRYSKTKELDSASWGVTLARMARRDYEETVYPAIPQAYSPYRMAYAAQIKGLKLPEPSLNLRVQPYMLYQFNRTSETNGSITKDNSFKAGGEIKWAITPQAVLDLTFNTDFAQADVDRAVNNLSRFNVFFPEKRQFFLENSGVFAGVGITGLKPFFSRTIGLANSQFNADPIPIDAGIRYTERNQKRTWAGMYVHQQGNDLQGAANFGVLRYLKNYGKQSNIGVMMTHRIDEADSEKDFARHDNTTVTLDGFIRPKDEFNIQYLVTASRDGDSTGYAGNFFAEYSPSTMYAFWNTTYIDSKYVPGMGFTFTTNTLYHTTGGFYIWRPKKWKFIRRCDPGFFVNYYQNASDKQFQQANFYIFPVYIIFQNGSLFEYAVIPTWQNINFDFSVLGLPIPQLEYYYTRHRFTSHSDQSKKYSISGSFEFGDYYNGKLQTTSANIRIAPIANIALTVDYEYNDFKGVGSEKKDLQTSLITGGLRLAYDANIQLSLFYQYNSYDQQGRWNVRGSWQFAPLSFLYLVFNDTSFNNTPAQNQSLICKLSYLKQF